MSLQASVVQQNVHVFNRYHVGKLYFRYKYDWKMSEAAKNIMRTHTTAVSARMLYKLAQQVNIVLRFESYKIQSMKKLSTGVHVLISFRSTVDQQ